MKHKQLLLYGNKNNAHNSLSLSDTVCPPRQIPTFLFKRTTSLHENELELEYLPCNWNDMKEILMQREMPCGVFTMTQFKLCRRQGITSQLLFFSNTVEMMEYINANGAL